MFGLDSDSTGNFIYLIALLAFLASGSIFRGKIKTSKVLTQLFWWFLIMMVIVFLYSFRHDFNNAKNRIKSELLPGHAIRTSEGKMSINISRDGHFYVNLKVNNKNVKFMIDTGASDMVMNKEDAKRVGINLEDLSFNRIYQTANGKTLGASVLFEVVEINGVLFYDVPASINNSKMGTSLLGMRFLRNFKRYEFYQDKLILTY